MKTFIKKLIIASIIITLAHGQLKAALQWAGQSYLTNNTRFQCPAYATPSFAYSQTLPQCALKNQMLATNDAPTIEKSSSVTAIPEHIIHNFINTEDTKSLNFAKDWESNISDLNVHDFQEASKEKPEERKLPEQFATNLKKLGEKINAYFNEQAHEIEKNSKPGLFDQAINFVSKLFPSFFSSKKALIKELINALEPIIKSAQKEQKKIIVTLPSTKLDSDAITSEIANPTMPDVLRSIGKCLARQVSPQELENYLKNCKKEDVYKVFDRPDLSILIAIADDSFDVSENKSINPAPITQENLTALENREDFDYCSDSTFDQTQKPVKLCCKLEENSKLTCAVQDQTDKTKNRQAHVFLDLLTDANWKEKIKKEFMDFLLAQDAKQEILVTPVDIFDDNGHKALRIFSTLTQEEEQPIPAPTELFGELCKTFKTSEKRVCPKIVDGECDQELKGFYNPDSAKIEICFQPQENSPDQFITIGHEYRHHLEYSGMKKTNTDFQYHPEIAADLGGLLHITMTSSPLISKQILSYLLKDTFTSTLFLNKGASYWVEHPPLIKYHHPNNDIRNYHLKDLYIKFTALKKVLLGRINAKKNTAQENHQEQNVEDKTLTITQNSVLTENIDGKTIAKILTKPLPQALIDTIIEKPDLRNKLTLWDIVYILLNSKNEYLIKAILQTADLTDKLGAWDIAYILLNSRESLIDTILKKADLINKLDGLCIKEILLESKNEDLTRAILERTDLRKKLDNNNIKEILLESKNEYLIKAILQTDDLINKLNSADRENILLTSKNEYLIDTILERADLINKLLIENIAKFLTKPLTQALIDTILKRADLINKLDASDITHILFYSKNEYLIKAIFQTADLANKLSAWDIASLLLTSKNKDLINAILQTANLTEKFSAWNIFYILLESTNEDVTKAILERADLINKLLIEDIAKILTKPLTQALIDTILKRADLINKLDASDITHILFNSKNEYLIKTILKRTDLRNKIDSDNIMNFLLKCKNKDLINAMLERPDLINKLDGIHIEIILINSKNEYLINAILERTDLINKLLIDRDELIRCTQALKNIKEDQNTSEERKQIIDTVLKKLTELDAKTKV